MLGLLGSGVVWWGGWYCVARKDAQVAAVPELVVAVPDCPAVEAVLVDVLYPVIGVVVGAGLGGEGHGCGVSSSSLAVCRGWQVVWRRVAGGGGFGVEADGECLGVSGALMGGPGVGCHPAMVEGEGGRPLQLGVVGGGVDDQVSLVIGGLGDLGQEVAQGWEGKAVRTWASGPGWPLGEAGAEVVIAVCVLGP